MAKAAIRAPGEAARLVMGSLAALEAGAGARLAALVAATGLGEVQAQNAVGKLAARGWAERLGPGLYRLTPEGRAAHAAGLTVAPGPKGPTRALQQRRHPDNFQARLWRSMRIRRVFTAAEVAADAMREEADPVDLAARYIKVLADAGYLARANTLLTSRPGHERRFRLVRDTGPLAPVWSRVRRELVDLNAARPEARDGRP